MKKFLLLGVMFLMVMGAFAQGKKPILLTGGNNGVQIEPLAGSTLNELYGAKFTPVADFTNVFQYKPMDVSAEVAAGYKKIVIEFAEAPGEGWNCNGYKFESIAGKTTYEIPLEGNSVADFTVFNWEGCRSSITIKRAYFSKDVVDADFSNPSLTPNISWDGATNTFSWTATSWNQLRNLKLPTGDITKYESLVIDCDFEEGNKFRILIYKGNDSKPIWVTSPGVSEFVLADVINDESYLTGCTDICISGPNSEGKAPGSAVINDFYLVKKAGAVDDEPEPVVLTPTDDKDDWYTGGEVVVKVNDYPDPKDKDSKRAVADPRWVVDPVNAQNNCIVVVSDDDASEEWDAQLFVQLPNNVLLPQGSEISVSMMVRAEEAQDCGGQAHQTPGDYNHWSGVPAISFTKEWTPYKNTISVSEFMAKGENNGAAGNKEGMGTLAFNLARKGGKSNIFYIDDIEVSYKVAEQPVWVEVITNGDMEGDDNSCFFKGENGGGKYNADLIEGVGKDGSKGIEVRSSNNPEAASWDAQFFIRVPYILPEGAKYQLKFDYKATEAVTQDTQAHGEPGDYNANGIGDINFETGWKTYEAEGTISGTMAKGWGGDKNGFMSFTFDLDKNDDVIRTFYFDNISVMLDQNKLDQYQAAPERAIHTFSVVTALTEAVAEGDAIMEEKGEELPLDTKNALTEALGNGKDALDQEMSDDKMKAATEELEKVIASLNTVEIVMPEKEKDRTFSYDAAIDFTAAIAEGLNVYIIVDVVEGQTILKEVTKVPANTGLYLVGEAGATYTVSIIKDFQSDEFKDNLLKSTINGVQKKEDGKTNYMLGTTSKGRGFHMLKRSGSYEQTKNKAYLSYAVDEANAPERLFIGEGEANRIANINVEKANGAWYTINGVKLNGVPTQKGMYIRNGNKVMIK